MERKQLILFTLIYFLIACLGIQNHEMWLDEAQHILLARDSHSLPEMFFNARYEGHPLLWNVILFGITRVTESLFVIQLFHVFISSFCAYLILKHAPFSFYVKLLIVFGYFLLYEYAIITRNYSISLLFLLLALVEICSSNRNYIFIFTMLGLLFNTHLFGSIISLVLVALLLRDVLAQPIRIKLISVFIILCSILFCLHYLIPPNDHFMNAYNSEAFFSLKRLSKVMKASVMGVLPIPDLLSTNYWGKNFIINHSPIVSALLSLVIFISPVALFRKHKTSFILYYASLFLIVLFIYFSPIRIGTRHCGFISILMLCGCWLAKRLPEHPILYSKDETTSSKFAKTWGHLFLAGVLLSQFCSGILVFVLDLRSDFSSAKNAGNYIHNFIPTTTPIALSHFTSGPALSMYANRKLFYLETNSLETFCKWNTNPMFIDDSTSISRMLSLLANKNEIILITNSEGKIEELFSKNIKKYKMQNLQIKSIGAFTHATVQSENYFMYSLQMVKPD